MLCLPAGSRTRARTQAAQLFRRELEHVTHQEIGVILLVILEACGRWAGKHPAVTLAEESSIPPQSGKSNFTSSALDANASNFLIQFLRAVLQKEVAKCRLVHVQFVRLH